MKILDIVILILILIFSILGFKRGFFKSVVMFLGVILVLILSYNLKNYLGDFLTLNLPFIKFNHILGGAVTLNIIMYQGIAFLLISIILTFVYKIIVSITGIFEKILNMTVVLGIPSKLLGLVIGFLEGTIIVYICLMIISQPFFNINVKNESNLAGTILEKTPIVSSYLDKPVQLFYDVRDIIKDENEGEIDLKITELILENNITSSDVMQKLVDSGKINVDKIQDVIDKYNAEVKND